MDRFRALRRVSLGGHKGESDTDDCSSPYARPALLNSVFEKPKHWRGRIYVEQEPGGLWFAWVEGVDHLFARGSTEVEARAKLEALRGARPAQASAGGIAEAAE